jgi:hypothetical protein
MQIDPLVVEYITSGISGGDVGVPPTRQISVDWLELNMTIHTAMTDMQ